MISGVYIFRAVPVYVCTLNTRPLYVLRQAVLPIRIESDPYRKKNILLSRIRIMGQEFNNFKKFNNKQRDDVKEIFTHQKILKLWLFGSFHTNFTELFVVGCRFLCSVESWVLEKECSYSAQIQFILWIRKLWCGSGSAQTAFWETSWIRIRVTVKDAAPDPEGKNRRIFAQKVF